MDEWHKRHYKENLKNKAERLLEIQEAKKRLEEEEIDVKAQLKDLSVKVGALVFNFLHDEVFKVSEVDKHYHLDFVRPMLMGSKKNKNGEWGKRRYYLCDDWKAV